MITFDDIRNSQEIRTYITQADLSLGALGYTEHSFAHVSKCAQVASSLLTTLGYPEREAELARIAGYMHDIGNMVNRHDHAQTGAVMAFSILHRMGMDPGEIAKVVSAIGHHDDDTACPIDPISAALLLADKTDVHRSRVRTKNRDTFDIHDRVNYAVEQADLSLDRRDSTLTLTLSINPEVCPVMEYFEIFLQRMLLCRKSAEFFHLTFKLNINGLALL